MADAIAPYLRLYLAQLRGQAQYRASFLAEVVGSFAVGFADLSTIFVVYRVTRDVGGFDFRSALLIAGLAGTGFALADLTVGNIDQVRVYVRSGRLDAILVRPLGSLGQLAAMDFAPRRVGRVLVAATVYVVAALRAGVDWTPARVALAAVAPLAGGALFGAVFVATATVAFWWVESGEFGNAFTYGGRDFAAVPMTVYRGVFGKLFAYGLGLAFTGYYPALALLGRPDPLGLPPVTGWLAPLAALVAVPLAGLAWRAGIRHYRSTGS